jgi:dipeptidyl aminopeptidase/acylaminoacyl peptidase
MRRILGLLVAILGGVFAGAFYFSSKLLYTNPYTCKTERYVYCKDPAELGLAFEDVEFQTSDGLRISGWWIPGQVGTPTVVLVHGRGVDRHEGMRFALPLHRAGFQLLLIDLRGCGKSQASMSTMSYYERRDVTAAVDYAAAKRGAASVGVFGFSMGAASSIHAMEMDPRIKAGAFEGGFADFRDIIADSAWSDYRLPRYPLLPIVTVLFESRGRLRVDEISPEKAIGRISPRPVFIIHGSADQRVPVHHGERLFAAAREPRWYWIVPGGAHTAAWQADQAKAESLVTEFFLKYL